MRVENSGQQEPDCIKMKFLPPTIPDLRDLSCSKICIDVTGETPHTVMNWVGPSRVQLSLIFSLISGLEEMRSLPTSAAC